MMARGADQGRPPAHGAPQDLVQGLFGIVVGGQRPRGRVCAVQAKQPQRAGRPPGSRPPGEPWAVAARDRGAQDAPKQALSRGIACCGGEFHGTPAPHGRGCG
ncbi:TPA_asm: UL37.5 [Human alphaherpesvirus 1]|nr:TPA_asm: UL37.5 [Human alphaherpesvirus 1]